MERHQIESARNDQPLVSVVIPVWNDVRGLAACLSGLRAQTYPAKQIEVIVVDNGSSDGSLEFASSFAGVLTLSEPTPGSYAARNTGLKRAQGDYIAFIDSDCRPCETWIEDGIAAAIKEPKLGILAGHVELSYEGCPESPAVLYERMFSFNQDLNAKMGSCVGANWLSPKSVLESFGGFDASLRSGGDTQLSRQISEAGYSVRYCAAMLVHHPARATIRSLAAKRRRVVGGKWATTPGVGFKALRLSARLSLDALLRSYHALGARGVPLPDRLKVVAVICTIWSVGLMELARLSLGSEPAR
jgi:glycosyltransferase involved in cell wall biosynthesis